jgi:hypothetical protein
MPALLLRVTQQGLLMSRRLYLKDCKLRQDKLFRAFSTTQLSSV